MLIACGRDLGLVVGDDGAKAVVPQSAGRLNRGDRLEWLGAYGPAP